MKTIKYWLIAVIFDLLLAAAFYALQGLGIEGETQFAVLRELDKLDKRGVEAVRATLAGEGFGLPAGVIDRLMAENTVVALIAPTTSRAWTNDRDDKDTAQGSTSTIAAVAGYPHLTVPMGFDRGMPVGISFIGGKWDDAAILSLGYAFEQKTQARRAPPGAATPVQPVP